MCDTRIRAMLCLAILLALPLNLAAQDPPAGRGSAMGGIGPAALGKVVVRVRGEGGVPLPVFAVVRIYSNFGSYQQTAGTREGSEVAFGNVPIGEYQIEVSAPGYQIAKQDASLLSVDSSTYVYVDLRPEGTPQPTAGSGGPPLLAPKALKELESGIAALRAGDLKKAQEHLDKVRKMAPQHPDVLYVQALLYLRQENLALAQANLERAVNIYPEHAAAQSALGILLFRRSEFPAAITALEKAVTLQPMSWQSHQVLALCYLETQSFEKARAHAERALEVSGNKAPELRLLVARALMAMKQWDRAQEELSAFIEKNPSHPDVAEAKHLQAELKRQMAPPEIPATVVPAAANAPADSRPQIVPRAGSEKAGGDPPGPRAVSASGVPEPARFSPRGWAPPSVDDSPPPLLKNTPCKLPGVLSAAGKRAVALAKNLEQITATERIEQSELDEAGNPHNMRTILFDYLVNVGEPRPGILYVDEDRKPLQTAVLPPHSFMANGMGAIALIFHPYYVQDFEMTCEGLTETSGHAAWSIYFKQRMDRLRGVRTYRIQGTSYNIALKGRAWIAANTFQVLRMETDLLEPVKGLRLEQEHMVIQYQPVEFKTRKVRLWLPADAEMYAFFRGRRYLHHHRFTDYKVFYVDVTQKIGEQKP